MPRRARAERDQGGSGSDSTTGGNGRHPGPARSEEEMVLPVKAVMDPGAEGLEKSFGESQTGQET